MLSHIPAVSLHPLCAVILFVLLPESRVLRATPRDLCDPASSAAASPGSLLHPYCLKIVKTN